MRGLGEVTRMAKAILFKGNCLSLIVNKKRTVFHLTISAPVLTPLRNNASFS